jgi:hypothetical protein
MSLLTVFVNATGSKVIAGIVDASGNLTTGVIAINVGLGKDVFF